MIAFSVILYLLLSAALLATAAKYAFGPVPAPHHRQALENDGVPLAPNLLVLLKALYVPMAAAFAAVAILIAALALGPIARGEIWASMAATGAALVLGLPTTYGTWHFERATGVRGPAKLAAVLTLLAVTAALVAFTA
ncbi:hypothetical protein [Antarcticirhabdus aurantiaca]|uniref:Uncharacterized protein n=1 Tax=Antarcticirhabdus aurantiaca TaxID=2606717 RepID=A0ACD4NQ20_9HYPH|nr:hypothetical protein [Antarcticirhabdus aurantiaca]WAJ28942.1 hypothetical protein OXU80_01415 [Jeongeuplla avenae]